MADNPSNKDKIQQVLIKQENEELKENQHKEIDYHRYWKDMYEKEHKLRQEAEGELTIIKGIGNTSPEMKVLNKENEGLKKENSELREDNKKLANEIDDRLNQLRKSGL